MKRKSTVNIVERAYFQLPVAILHRWSDSNHGNPTSFLLVGFIFVVNVSNESVCVCVIEGGSSTSSRNVLLYFGRIEFRVQVPRGRILPTDLAVAAQSIGKWMLNQLVSGYSSIYPWSCPSPLVLSCMYTCMCLIIYFLLCGVCRSPRLSVLRSAFVPTPPGCTKSLGLSWPRGGIPEWGVLCATHAH